MTWWGRALLFAGTVVALKLLLDWLERWMLRRHRRLFAREIEADIAAEREACAAIAEEGSLIGEEIARRIRAREKGNIDASHKA